MIDYEHRLNLNTRPPLVGVEVVAFLAQTRAARIVDAVEDGKFAWAWNFSTTPDTRRELRIWRGSVAAFLRTRGADGGAQVSETDVLDDVLPQRDLWTGELRRRWDINRSLIELLIAEKVFKVTATAPKDGSLNGARKIERASLVRFLRERRVGAVVGAMN